MEYVVSIGITVIILWQVYKLMQIQRKKQAEQQKIERNMEDRNIEWSGHNGQIALVKKGYNELVLKDDHRTGTKDASHN